MEMKSSKQPKKSKPAVQLKDIKPKKIVTGGAEKIGHGRRKFKIRYPGA